LAGQIDLVLIPLVAVLWLGWAVARRQGLRT
jgi:hypothetical protein